MAYLINFGILDCFDDAFLENIINENNSDKGIGLHRILPNEIKFERLNDSISKEERNEIINNYWNCVDNTFRSFSDREENWVTSSNLNGHKGHSSRYIGEEFMEDFKKVNGGREFLRSIKDSYVDNSSYPSVEVCLINTPSFKSSLSLLAKEVLENTDSLSLEQIDFIKWAYWWGTKCILKSRNLSSIRFLKD